MPVFELSAEKFVKVEPAPGQGDIGLVGAQASGLGQSERRPAGDDPGAAGQRPAGGLDHVAGLGDRAGIDFERAGIVQVPGDRRAAAAG